jgi:hypothetical protein
VVVPTDDRNTFNKHDVAGERITNLAQTFESKQRAGQVGFPIGPPYMFDYQSDGATAPPSFHHPCRLEFIPSSFSSDSDQFAIHGKADTSLIDELGNRIDASSRHATPVDQGPGVNGTT